MNESGHHRVDLGPEAPGSSLDLEQMWFVIREKAWLIALFGLIGIFGGLAYIHHTPLTYYSQAVIEVDADAMKVVNYTGVEETKDPLSDEMAQTVLAVFQSRAFAQDVIEENHLLENPGFMPPEPDGKPPSMDEAIGTLIGMSHAAVRPGTRFIEVGVKHSNPVMAKEIANMLANAYMERSRKQQGATDDAAIKYLKDQANDASIQLSQSSAALQAYNKSHDSGSLDEANDTIVTDLRTKSAELSAAHSQRVKLQADDEYIQKHLNDPDALLSIPSVANHPSIVASRQAIKEDEEKIDQLKFWYREPHPKMIQARKELANEQQTLQDNLSKIPQVIHAAREAAEEMESRMQKEVDDQKAQVETLNDDHIQFDVLNRQVETNRALYDGLLTRLKEATVATGAETTRMHMFEPAQIPIEPLQARKSRTLSMALGGGLGLGLVLAMALHFMDSSLKTVDQAEDVLGLTVLASIPRQTQSKLKESGLALVKAPGSPVGEAFRSLRTSVYLAGRHKGRKVVLFTSTLAGEGKTFCSTNYATALAQQGLKTLLIDADLRSPMVATVLLAGQKLPGLGELLLKKVDAATATHETEVPNLFAMPAGDLLPNPAEVLASTGVGELIKKLAESYDRIVIDTAPVTAVSDTLLLLEHAEGVCVVAHAGKTPRKWILRGLKLIREAGATPVGVILNQVPMRMAAAYSYYPGKYGEPEVYGGGYKGDGKKGPDGIEIPHPQARF